MSEKIRFNMLGIIVIHLQLSVFSLVVKRKKSGHNCITTKAVKSDKNRTEVERSRSSCQSLSTSLSNFENI